MKKLKNNFHNFIFVNCIIFILISFNTNIFAKSPPPGTGKADVKANILLMLDNSGSMGWTSYSVNRPLNAFDTVVDSSGDVYVTQYYRHQVKKYNSSGTYLKTIGSYGTGNTNFRYPTSIDVDSNDNIYILDYYNRRIISYNSSGQFRCKATIPSSTYLYDDLEINSSNVIHITNYFSKRVYQYNASCNKTGEINIDERIGPMAIDSSSNLWFFRMDGSRQMLKYSSNGTHLGYQNLTYGCPGGTKATYVTDMEADSSGNVYYTDLYCHAVIKYDTNINYQSKFGS